MGIDMKAIWEVLDQVLAKIGAASVIVLFLGYIVLSDPNRVLVVGKSCIAITVPEKATIMLSNARLESEF